jgi:response regulator of citrate/malate metabolism
LQQLDTPPPSRSINSLLIVEDDGMLLEVLAEDSRSAARGCAVFGASSIAAAHEVLNNNRIEAALVDLGLPDGDGIRLIADIKRREPSCEVLVITVFADKERVL